MCAPSSAWWPIDDRPPPLPRANCDLREAVHIGVQREKAIEDTGHEEHASAGELIFVELQLDAAPPGERNAMRRDNAGKGGAAPHADKTVNLAFGAQRIGEVRPRCPNRKCSSPG